MSAKNSNATADDYARYDADKAKAGEVPYELVTLKRYKAEDKLPEVDPVYDVSDWVVMWDQNGTMYVCQLSVDDPEWPERTCIVPEWSCEDDVIPTAGTSWAYIPEATL